MLTRIILNFILKYFNLPANVMPIFVVLSRGNVMVAYVVPRSGAKPESSDCAGLMARSTARENNKRKEQKHST